MENGELLQKGRELTNQIGEYVSGHDSRVIAFAFAKLIATLTCSLAKDRSDAHKRQAELNSAIDFLIENDFEKLHGVLVAADELAKVPKQ